MNWSSYLIVLLFTAILASCTSMGGSVPTKNGSLTWGPTSLLGDVAVKGYHLKNGNFELNIDDANTQNPSKNLTDIIEKYIFWEGVKYVIGSLADLEKLRVSAAHAEKLKEFDNAAAQQGFESQLNLLKQQQAAPAL